MSKLYNDRYVKDAPTKKSVDLTERSNRSISNGKIVETIVCIAIGSVVLYTMCSMVFAVVKPMMVAIEEIKNEEVEKDSIYQQILYSDVDLTFDELN